jgi:molybdate transport system substrate-binding protein
MKKTPIALAATTLLLVAMTVTGCSRADSGAPGAKTEVLISAAASLAKPLAEIKADLEREHPEIKLTVNLAASGTLQKQIEQGAPADLFWSAGTKQMDVLEQKGLLLDGTRTDAARNELVLIMQKTGSTLSGWEGVSLLKSFAIGTPETVPAGQYAQQTLQHMMMWDAVKDKIVYAKDVTQVLTAVERGDVEAGAVYRSDARTSDQVREVAAAPVDSHDPILYPLAVLKSSAHPQQAKVVRDYLLGANAQAKLEQAGFFKAGQ